MRMVRLYVYTGDDGDDRCSVIIREKISELKLNKDKTTLLKINMTSEKQIMINDSSTEKVKYNNNLGIIIDRLLKLHIILKIYIR